MTDQEIEKLRGKLGDGFEVRRKGNEVVVEKAEWLDKWVSVSKGMMDIVNEMDRRFIREECEKLPKKQNYRCIVEPKEVYIYDPSLKITVSEVGFHPQDVLFSFSVEGKIVDRTNIEEMSNHLAECLQAYLNKQ